MRNHRDEIRDCSRRASMGSLFERLVADEEDVDAPNEDNEFVAAVSSIKRHLRVLLNSRAGGSAATPDHGIADFNDGAVDTRDMVKNIATSIQKTIETYEPRVSDVIVQHIPHSDRPLEMHFQIKAHLSVHDRNELISLSIQMNEARNAQVL